jgi:hypothetical protein
MYNILNKLEYYKGKSAMIIETSIGVSYGTSTPFVKFKFAPRDNYKAPGQWDDNNVYWLSSYVDIAVFTKNIKLVAEGNLEKYEMKNPAKKITLQVFQTKNENDGIEYINFNFYRDNVKINTSLIKISEFYGMYMFFNNLVNTYCMVSQIALMKYDIWYEFFGKNKKQQTSNKQNIKPKQQYQKNQSQPKNNNFSPNNVIESIEDDINSMQSEFNFDNDVPF